MKHILILLFALSISNISSGQKFKSSYEFIIDDYSKELYSIGYISKNDTLFFVCGFSDCQSICCNYDFELKNKKIQFRLPTVNKAHPQRIFYLLSTPKFEKQLLVIYVADYLMKYNKSDDDEIIFLGTTKYIFRYNRTEKKYIFSSKEEYG